MQKRKLYCRKIMYAILSAAAMLLLPVGSYAQPDGITLQVKNVPIGEVLEQIEDNYGYMFLYSDDAVDLQREVSISAKNVTVSYVLDRILDEKTGYEVNQKQVVIFLKSSGKNQVSENGGGNSKDSFTVNGTVKDAGGVPIAGVMVIEKGTMNGASTDIDGNWSINVADPDAVLVFSCLGYRETEIPVASQKNIYVNLSDDMENLEEVVVIGYGTVRKADLAGSVAVMKLTSYENQPAQSLTDVLFGTRTGYPCCYSNMHQGWPKFTQNLWYATAEGGVAAMVYSPSEVTLKVGGGREVTITEDTVYPMGDEIRFEIRMSGRKGERFPFLLRRPGWCDEPEVAVNGEIFNVNLESDVMKIVREWKDGDVVCLRLPMEVEVSKWHENSVAVERGPLVYALGLAEHWEKKYLSGDEAVQFGLEYYEVTTTDKWNYGLVESMVRNPGSCTVEIDESKASEKFFWNMEGAPVRIRVWAQEHPYWEKYGPDAGPLPFSVRTSPYPEEEIVLVPYGCTTLRISEFPVVRH